MQHNPKTTINRLSQIKANKIAIRNNKKDTEYTPHTLYFIFQ
nr:MAG TPA: hypothetical protein [Caudoviricetes sp.]